VPANPIRASWLEVRRIWGEPRLYQSISLAIGAALIASGLVHLGVFMVDGGPWKGPISWRKPVTFGLSFGLTTITLAWISRLLPSRRLLSASMLAVAIGSLLEVVLVTIQRWRGVPSHFNFATPFDAFVFNLMGFTVAVIAVGIVVLTILAMFPLDATPAMVLAVRASLLILIVAQVLGGAIIANGIGIDRAPNETDLAVFGAAGAMKLPHAVTMHAIQVLPLLAMLLGALRIPARKQMGVMWLAVAAYVCLALVTVLQTFQGRAPADLTAPSFALLLSSGALALLALLRLRPGPQAG
jgi:hypothetical protein